MEEIYRWKLEPRNQPNKVVIRMQVQSTSKRGNRHGPWSRAMKLEAIYHVIAFQGPSGGLCRNLVSNQVHRGLRIVLLWILRHASSCFAGQDDHCFDPTTNVCTKKSELPWRQDFLSQRPDSQIARILRTGSKDRFKRHSRGLLNTGSMNSPHSRGMLWHCGLGQLLHKTTALNNCIAQLIMFVG